MLLFSVRCQVMEITLSRGYNELSFREDLKVLYNRLGIENRRIVLMFGDQHVVEDGNWDFSFPRQWVEPLTTLPPPNNSSHS